MSLSDCPECWDTPCTCGHEYSHYKFQDRLTMVKAVLRDAPQNETLRVLQGVLPKGYKIVKEDKP